MKRWLWIVGTGLLVVLIGGGVTWGLLASQSAQQKTKPLSAAETADFVYTGEDLAGFLIDQDAAREVTGGPIQMAAVDYNFWIDDHKFIEPTTCSVIVDALTPSPAGFREVHGGYLDGSSATGRAVHLSQSVYQFPTLADAATSFAQISKAWSTCAEFTVIYDISAADPAQNSASLTALQPDSPREELVAALVSYTGGQEKTSAIVTVRVNNVITTGRVISTGPSAGPALDENTVQRLATAMLAHITAAEHAKADGTTVQAAPPTAWEIGFGSIGPINIEMTAQQATDILGEQGLIAVDAEYCSAYHLGNLNRSFLGGLAESEGATGRLDSISVHSRMGYEPSEPAELWPSRPMTATGITLGSTLSELKAAYSGQLKVLPHLYVEGGHYGHVAGPNDTMMMFNIDENNVVTMIFTGRTPQAGYVEGCA